MKLWIVFVFALMTSCASTPAMAQGLFDAPEKDLEDQWIFAVGGWSKHTGGFSNGVTNETHKIVGVEHNGYSTGYFQNSYGRPTWFAAYTVRKEMFMEHLEFSGTLGVNYGYRECMGDNGEDAKVCPHGYLSVSYTKYAVVPSIRVIPGIDDKGIPRPAVIVFSPEIRF